MLLIGVNKENGWLRSQWNLTYPTGWEGICKAVSFAYPYFGQPEVLKNNSVVNISEKSEILRLQEGMNLTLRGISSTFHCPVMITFYNQTKIVEMSLPSLDGEFSEADYEKFNKSCCDYLTSIEIAMNRN